MSSSNKSYSYIRIIAKSLYESIYNNNSSPSDVLNIGEITISGTIQNSSIVKRFPLAALTANSTTLTDGTYICSASTEYNSTFFTFRAFDRNTGTNYASINNIYNSTGGQYLGSVSTIVNNVEHTGEWLQIQLPYSINITSIYLLAATNCNGRLPKNLVIAGSNNGTTWNMIYENITQPYINITPVNNVLLQAYTTINISSYTVSDQISTTISNQAYSYFRIIARELYDYTYNNSLSTSVELISISEITISGISENSNIIKRYPPSALSANITSLSDGDYICKSYSEMSSVTQAYNAFDINNTTVFQSAIGYDASGGKYIGSERTIVDNIIQKGEWIQIQLPTPIYITSIYIQSRLNFNGRLPKNLIIAGSNNGYQWTKIYENFLQRYTNISPINVPASQAFTTIDLLPYSYVINPSTYTEYVLNINSYIPLDISQTNVAIVNTIDSTESRLISNTNILIKDNTDVIQSYAISLSTTNIRFDYSYLPGLTLTEFTAYAVCEFYQDITNRIIFQGFSDSGYVTGSLKVDISASTNNILINGVNTGLTLSLNQIHFIILSADTTGTLRVYLNNNTTPYTYTTTVQGFPGWSITGFSANNNDINAATSYDSIYEYGIFEKDLYTTGEIFGLQGYLINKYFMPRGIENLTGYLSNNQYFFNDKLFSVAGGAAPTDYRLYTDTNYTSISTLNFSYGTVSGYTTAASDPNNILYNCNLTYSQLYTNNTSRYIIIESTNSRFSSYFRQTYFENNPIELYTPTVSHTTSGSNYLINVSAKGQFMDYIDILLYDVHNNIIDSEKLIQYNSETSLVLSAPIALNRAFFVKVNGYNNINYLSYTSPMYLADSQFGSERTITSVNYIFQNNQLNTVASSNYEMTYDASYVYIANQKTANTIGVSILTKPGSTQHYTSYRFIVQSVQKNDECVIGDIHISGQRVGSTDICGFPPAVMTSNTTVLSDGTYDVSASSIFGANQNPWRAFDSNETGTFWHTAVATYKQGPYIGTVTTFVDGRSVMGEWIQINFPFPVKITDVFIKARILNTIDYYYDSRLPKNILIAASNNKTNWTEYYSAVNLQPAGNLMSEYTSINNISPNSFQSVVNSYDIVGTGPLTLDSITTGIYSGQKYVYIGDTSGSGTSANVIIHRLDIPNMTSLNTYNYADISNGYNGSGESRTFKLCSGSSYLYGTYMTKSSISGVTPIGSGYNIVLFTINPTTLKAVSQYTTSQRDALNNGDDITLKVNPIIASGILYVMYRRGNVYRMSAINTSTLIASGTIYSCDISAFNINSASNFSFTQHSSIIGLLYATYETTINNRIAVLVDTIFRNTTTTLQIQNRFFNLYDDDNTYNSLHPTIAYNNNRLYISYETRGKTTLNVIKDLTETDIVIATLNVDISNRPVIDSILQDKTLNTWGENNTSNIIYDGTTLYCAYLTNSSTQGNCVTTTSDIVIAQLNSTIVNSKQSIYLYKTYQNSILNTSEGINKINSQMLYYGSYLFVCHLLENTNNNILITRYDYSNTSNDVIYNPVQIRVNVSDFIISNINIMGANVGGSDFIYIAGERNTDNQSIYICRIPVNFSASTSYVPPISVIISAPNSNSNLCSPNILQYNVASSRLYCMYDLQNTSTRVRQLFLRSYDMSLTQTNFVNYAVSEVNMSTKTGTTFLGGSTSYLYSIKAIMDTSNNINYLYYNNNNLTLNIIRTSGNITSTSDLSSISIPYNIYNTIDNLEFLKNEDFVINAIDNVYYLSYLKYYSGNKGTQNVIVQINRTTFAYVGTQLLDIPFKSSSSTYSVHLAYNNNALYSTFYTYGYTSTNYAINPVFSDVILSRIEISGSSTGTILGVSNIIQNQGFNTTSDDFNPAIIATNNNIFISFSTKGVIMRGQTRQGGAQNDTQTAIVCFNVGNIPVSLSSGERSINVNYGLYQNSRIVLKSFSDTTKNYGVKN